MLDKIRERLEEFKKEMDSTSMTDQFQVGYYVGYEEIEWLLTEIRRLHAEIVIARSGLGGARLLAKRLQRAIDEAGTILYKANGPRKGE